MPPLLQAALLGLLRHGLTAAATYVVAHGIWTESEAATYVTAAALAVLGLGWSLWEKHKGRIRFLQALDAPAGTHESRL